MIDKTQSAVQSMLSQIRQYEARAKGLEQPDQPAAAGPSFSEMLQGAVKSVDNLQQQAQIVAERSEEHNV